MESQGETAERGIELRDQRCLDELDVARNRVAQRRAQVEATRGRGIARLVPWMVIPAFVAGAAVAAGTFERTPKEAPATLAQPAPPPVSPPPAPAPPPAIVEPKRPEPSLAPPMPARAVVDAPSSGAKILGTKFCKSIVRKECAGSPRVFSFHDGGTYVWMEVSTPHPVVLRHVYYQDDRKTAEIALPVRFSHMRTWSRLGPQAREGGRWRVEIVDESGAVLESLNLPTAE